VWWGRSARRPGREQTTPTAPAGHTRSAFPSGHLPMSRHTCTGPQREGGSGGERGCVGWCWCWCWDLHIVRGAGGALREWV
jgi:hypothetical protein